MKYCHHPGKIGGPDYLAVDKDLCRVKARTHLVIFPDQVVPYNQMLLINLIIVFFL
jgi:hypothetical protein